MLMQAAPPTDELLEKAASNPGFRRLVDLDGEQVALFLQSDRILAYRGEEVTPFGLLRFGGPHSGAIWMDGQLIGEYDKTLDGEFFVVEVEDGFLSPELRRKEDPVAYLIEKAVSR